MWKEEKKTRRIVCIVWKHAIYEYEKKENCIVSCIAEESTHTRFIFRRTIFFFCCWLNLVETEAVMRKAAAKSNVVNREEYVNRTQRTAAADNNDDDNDDNGNSSGNSSNSVRLQWEQNPNTCMNIRSCYFIVHMRQTTNIKSKTYSAPSYRIHLHLSSQTACVEAFFVYCWSKVLFFFRIRTWVFGVDRFFFFFFSFWLFFFCRYCWWKTVYETERECHLLEIAQNSVVKLYKSRKRNYLWICTNRPIINRANRTKIK